MNEEHANPMPMGQSAPDIYCDAKAVMCRPQTLTERLVERKIRMEAELADVNAALKSLNDSPEVADAINNITRVFGDRLR